MGNAQVVDHHADAPRMTMRLTAGRCAAALTIVAAVALTVDQFAVAVIGCLLALAVVGLAAVARHRAAVAALTAAEARSRARATLLEAVVNRIDAGVLVVNEEGDPLMHNTAAEAMLGADLYLPDGATPFPFEDLPLARALRGERCAQVEMSLSHSDRPDAIVLSVSARPLPDEAGVPGAMATIHDITDHTAADAQTAATISDLRAFARVAAHDLKSPLTAVAGFAELLEDSLRADADPAALRPTASRLVAGIDRMHRLVDDILVYATARDGSVDLGPVDLNDVVSEVIAERTAHLRTGGDRALFPDIYIGPLPVVHADASMTRQLLDNLIGNAIKYALPGRQARIDISAHSRQGDQGWIRVEIADRGIGIPAADKPHIFASYHRCSDHARGYTGTGLGLAICQRIVERHGGRIGVSDNPGGGTRFWFTMPTASIGERDTATLTDPISQLSDPTQSCIG